MAVKSLPCLVVLLLLLFNYGAKGRLLAGEEFDCEKQFKLLQKTGVNTIKNKYGDIYDCVDFYKQPAFDHPLLANHSFHQEMKPSSFAFEEEAMLSQEREVHTNTKSRGEGCPTGTVPIKRLSRDDFIKMQRFTKDYTSRTISNGFENHFAVLQSYPNPSTKIYHGATGSLSYYNFNVSNSQYSSGEIIMQNGDDTIKVGWTINPTINKDNRTRSFQYFNAGQSHCFNMLCPGFVSVNKDIPIDDVLEPVPERGDLYSLYIKIFKDPKDGNWWLIFNHIIQGFWPGKLFNGLANSATFVSFGGETYGPDDEPLPPMGSGYKGIPHLKTSASVTNITVLDENFNEDNQFKETETYTDDSHYAVIDGVAGTFGRVVFYGGTAPQILVNSAASSSMVVLLHKYDIIFFYFFLIMYYYYFHDNH